MTATLEDHLRQIKYFEDVPPDTLKLLSGKTQVRHYAPGDVLCRAGEPGDWLFIVKAGDIAVHVPSDAGEVEVRVMTAGEIGGEYALFSHGQRSATLVAKGDVALWVLEHVEFQRLMDEHPSLARVLLKSLSQQLSNHAGRLAQLLSSDLDRRTKIAFFDAKPYLRPIFDERNTAYQIRYVDARLSIETVDLAAGCEVVCAFVNDNLEARVVDQLATLGVRLIALRCAGYNHVDLAACRRHGIRVLRVPAYSPHAVAEHAMALILTLNRKIHRAHQRVRDGNFALDGLLGFDLHGKTAGVIGAGKIGVCMIEILRGFGMRVLVHARRPDHDLAARTGCRFVPLDQLYRESDIVSLHVPLAPETRHLIDAQAIAAMKRGVMLINTSRGALVDTEALLAGLKTGQVGYAGLDVYEEERAYFFEDFSDRVIEDDALARLTTFNNVLVTPHQAFLTREALGNIADTTLGNIGVWLGSRGAGALDNEVL